MPRHTSRRHSEDSALDANGIGSSPEDDLRESRKQPMRRKPEPMPNLPSQEAQQAKDESAKYENGGLGY